MPKCDDPVCKTNDQNSDYICPECIVELFKHLSAEEVYELYYNVAILLKISPQTKDLMIYLFGEKEVEKIEALKENWFDFINSVLLVKKYKE